MRHVCRLALFLCLLPACSFVAVAQSWQAPTLYPTGNDAPSRIATADLLGTQSSDVLAVTAGHDLDLYANDGAGHLNSSPQILRENVTAVTAGKFSGSMMDDLLVLSSATPTAPLQLMLLPSQGGRTFGAAVAIAPQLALGATCQLNAADFNGDGAPDVLVFCPGSNSLAIGTNNGKSGFTFTSVPGFLESGRQIRNVGAGDLDGDGLADIVVQSSPVYSPADSRIDVLWGSAYGAFSPQLNYVTQPDATALYVAKVEGHPSANLVTASSNSVSVFADQADRNALTQSAALPVPSGCTLTAVASGRIVNVKYSLGQDVVLAATCGSQNQMLVYPNAAQTRLTITPTLSSSSEVPSLSMSVAVLNTSGTVIPTGTAAVTLGTATSQEPLVSGSAQLNPQPPPGTNMLRVSYDGDSNNAGAAETVAIVLADASSVAGSPSSFLITGPTITPSVNLLVGTPYTVTAEVQQNSSGSPSVLTAPSGTVTFSDNGAAIATAQGVPSESLSPWATSDCSFNGSAWVGTQCAADGSGSYQIAYEQDKNVFSSLVTFSTGGTNLVAASFMPAGQGSATGTTQSRTYQVGTASQIGTSISPAARTGIMSPSFSRQTLTPMASAIQLPASGIITTVAGDGTAGYLGDGSAATSAEIYYPNGVALDSSGNVYIADTNNARIRKLTASTGVISTVAGIGYGGFSGDGGLATNAEIERPQGVAVDSAGNIYIADDINMDIRKVTVSTGIITTVAGGPSLSGCGGDGGLATNAEIGSPYGIAVDSAGNIYFTSCSRIRKVTASTGIITTVAGNGTSGYSGDGGLATNAGLYPMGVAVDSSGNIYIADSNNDRIRKVTASTGIITTVAGNGTYGYSGDGGPATSAEIGSPYGVAVDSSGNIYIADSGNDRIRKVTATTGIITTLAGNGTSGYSGDGSLATNAEINGATAVAADLVGNIYIADTYNSRIRVVGGVKLTPSISLSCSPNPITYQAGATQTATCTAAVGGGATGTVTMWWNGNTYGTATLSGGTASLVGFNGLGAGNYVITATYNGDSNNNSVSATPFTETIDKATPSISLSCSPNTSVYDSQPGPLTTCSASVTNDATGTVALSYNSIPWSTLTLSGGTASISGFDYGTAAGPYSIVGDYSGDANNNAVSGSTIFAVTKANTTITGGFAANPITYGQSIVVSGQVSCNSACGNLEYFIDGTAWGINSLNSSGGYGAGWDGASVGNHSIQVNYLGDANHNPSSWGPATITVTQVASSVSLSCSPNPADSGQAVSCAATVSGGANGESVDFLDGATQIGVGTISSGVATFSTTSLAVGTHSLSAEYVGDVAYSASTSNAVSESINNPGTVTEVSSSLNPSSYGQNVTFSALVNTGGTAPTGNVTFENGGASIGSGSVSTVSTTNELRYSTNFGAWATNDAVTIIPAATTAPDGSQTASQLTVGSGGGYYILDSFPCSAGVTTYSVWLKQSANPSTYTALSVRFFDGSGTNLFTEFPWVQPLSTWSRLSATYTAPAGTASCTMGIEQNDSTGSAAPGRSVYAWGAQVEVATQPGPYIATNGAAAAGNGGLATFTTSSLPVGGNSITAVYGGDSNDTASTSPVLTQTVTSATPSISASCSPNPVAYLSYYSCTADVSGGATGTVTWPAIFGGATTSLSGGATSTPAYQATAPPATYSGTVTYNGDGNYNSISTSVSITSVAISQSIDFTPPPSPVTYGVSPIALSATATSGLPVTFSVLSGPGTISGNTLTITGPGTVVVAANQGGNGYYLPAAQLTQSVVVNQTPTVTTLSSSLDPSTYGQGVTFSALVNTGGTAPTGNVTFENGGASVESGAIAPVSATNLIPASTSGANGANWNVWDYPSTTHTVANAAAPDGSNTALAVTVAGSDHTVVQQSPPQYLAPYSSVYGHTYTFSIWARTPNGCSSFGVGMENDTAWEGTSLPSPISAVWQRFSVTYTFTQPSDSNEVDSYVAVPAGCTVQLWGWQFEEASQPGPYIATNGASASGSGGVATFTTSSLPAGSNSITAVYGGDTNNIASTSAPLTQTVTAVTPTLSVATSGSPSLPGASVTFTATISSGPSGTITFYDGGSPIGTGTISGTTASFTTSSLTVGSHSIAAGWAGNADYSSISSSAISQVVNPGSQTISFAPLASPVTYGVSPIALSATATSGLPVTFSVLSGPGTVSGSTLTITGAGTIVVAANQTGNAEYSAAPQVTQGVVVNKATPTISWATPAAIIYGTALSGTQLNATSGGVAGTFVYSPASGTVLGAGTQTLSVTFTPTDSTDYNSASGTTSLTVNKATGVFTIASSANPSVYGAAVNFTVSGPAAATGVITLLDGANPIGTGTLSNGVATVSVPLFAAGSHSLTASYPGDANYLPSTSATYTQTVNTAAVVIAIASTVNPSIYGETVTFTFTFHGVSGGAVPTGTAEIADGVNNLGTLTLNSPGVATFTTSALVAGTHSITAAYQGDSNYH